MVGSKVIRYPMLKNVRRPQSNSCNAKTELAKGDLFRVRTAERPSAAVELAAVPRTGGRCPQQCSSFGAQAASSCQGWSWDRSSALTSESHDLSNTCFSSC